MALTLTLRCSAVVGMALAHGDFLAPPRRTPGGDRDPHGCIPSAGYQWCAALDKCYRPFEEECTEAPLPNSTEDAPNSTGNGTMGGDPVAVGGDKDRYGCYVTAGYTWCAARNECLRPWEETCESWSSSTDAPMSSGPSRRTPGGDRDPHGCIPSAGYQWCAALDKCYRPFEEECTEAPLPNSTDEDAPNSTGNATTGSDPVAVGGDKDRYGCYVTAGYTWCAARNECLRPWEETCESWTTEAPLSSGPDAPTVILP